MNNNFILIDKTNNLQKNATSIIKINFENRDYLVYSTDESEVNKQIFVSKLILNSEGKVFIDNILPEEKNKLSNIVYNIIILTPSNFKKGMLPSELLKDIKEKLLVNLSLEIPQLDNQEYYANCSIAITNREFVMDAIRFYNDNLNTSVKVEEQVTPTWSIPTETPQTVVEPIPSVVNTPVPNTVPNIIQSENDISNMETTVPQMENIITQPINNTSVGQSISNVEEQKPLIGTISGIPNNEPVMPDNIAVVSDPSLGASGFNVQPNLGKQKNAGFTLNKYIIIGTVCILLAIAVVVVAYILIQKKINGA